ncbi:hypothetical protein T8K17_01865 [Thalassobaculum sp. OXR-137]|uniref:hypothetical protein n=1 Tax=Thalassobaculum sp. OXR-137 TaxID=3100173 RepID=UPI002AC928A6|nr:hypothetical protein [Thalassobaculum sp. OXR-137]WPZ33210.1 hypothetical protein T8K17_18450 [Thalassobaculum sp. OXR-137]WPZ34897.1 hypothetical protein T8K17_01865 [Thalassobaculum sp. OXR-137]
MNASMILIGIQIADAIAAGIPNAIAAKRAIERMVAENRDPTDAEWADINAVTDELRAKLHGDGSA